MMKPYLREREKEARISKATGIALTIGVHVAAVLCLGFTGLKYIYPPPEEQSFLIDFEQEEEAVTPKSVVGRQPQAEEIDISKPVDLVQKSESPVKSDRPNMTAEAKPDSYGDVEVPAPKEEINQNALFPGMSKKDSSLAPHAASDPRAEFKAGQTSGNTSNGKTDGSANANVKGRKVMGTLPLPSTSVQNYGSVVVDIWVDNYGNVTKAQAGAQGTTVTDKNLWAAARAAAMNAHFSQSPDTPVQRGTITYVFKLK